MMSVETVQQGEAGHNPGLPTQRKRERAPAENNVVQDQGVQSVNPQRVERTVRSRRTANVGMEQAPSRRVRTRQVRRVRPSRASREDALVQNSGEVFAEANRYFSRRFTVDTGAPLPRLELPGPSREHMYLNEADEWVIELPRAQPGEAPPFISLDELTRRVNERQDQIAERIRPTVRPGRQGSGNADGSLRIYHDEGRFNTYDEHLVFMQAEEDRKAKFIAASAHFPPADENDVEHEEGRGECCCICMGNAARYISVCCAKTEKADITTHHTPFLCNACLRALVATPKTHRKGCPLCRGEMIDIGEVRWDEALEAWEYISRTSGTLDGKVERT